MIPQNIKYFRFEPQTYSDGSTYMAPLTMETDSSTGETFYRGYDLSPFTIKYFIHRDVDLQPDTFVITLDSYFFQNPTNDPKYIPTTVQSLTDPLNTFPPSTNHVIAIGPIPENYHSWANLGTETYCYEDNGKLKSWNQIGASKIEITCVSFLKVLAEFQSSTKYILNNYLDDLNTLQIYYEYRDAASESSAPYFAPKDTSNKNKYGEYRIRPASTGEAVTFSNYDDASYLITHPLFSFFTGSMNEEGYATSKIAWRLLQEVGWCREDYITSANDAGASVRNINSQVSVAFINPYQYFYCPNSSNFNPIIMGTESTEDYTNFKFKAFDIDGLRYEYAAEATGTETIYEETYLNSFDPSRQSLLANLKSLADVDGLYLNITCCPKFVQQKLVNNQDLMFTSPEIVWDYSNVYNNIDNLKRWGVSAGFKPKVFIRRNTAQIYDFDTVKTGTENAEFIELVTTTILTLGAFNNSPLGDIQSQVLVNKATWQQDQSDVINKLLVKYGQGTDYANNYIELPLPSVLEDSYVLDLSGSVGDAAGAATIQLNVMYIDSGTKTYTMTRTYPIGSTSFDISNDIMNTFRGNEHFQILSSGDSLIFIPSDTLTKTLWKDNNSNPSLHAVSFAVTYSGTPSFAGYVTYSAYNTALNNKNTIGYTTSFIENEPFGFGIARDSQKLNGTMAAKISLPEVLTVPDVLKVADRVFKKLGKTKYRCQVECANTDAWQLPLFALYNIRDNTHTKRVVNDEGPSVQFIINGEAGDDGYITLAIPSPYSHNLVGMVVDIVDGQVPVTMLNNIKSQFDALSLGDITSSIDLLNNSITFTYGTEVQNSGYLNSEAFYQTSFGVNVNGIIVKRISNPPSQFKDVVFDEYLPLVSYDSDSTKGTYTCTFGIPNEDLSNVISQAQTWIGDVQKQQ
jgi:hypothetical protein